MRTTVKTIIWILAILFSIGFLLNLGIRLIFSEARLKQILQDQVRSKLDREVRVERIDLGFTGLTLKKFQLSYIPTFNTGTFLTVDRVTMRWALRPLLSKKLQVNSIYIPRGTLTVKDGSPTGLTTTFTDVWVTGDFAQTKTQGRLAIESLRNPVYSGKKISMNWNLRDMDAKMAGVNGDMHLNQGPGAVQNISRLASSSRVARIALLPLVMLQNIDRAGFIKLGLPDLSQLTIDHINGDYQFSQGLMTIETFQIAGRELSVGATGTVQLGPGDLNVDVDIHTPKPTLGGEMDVKLHVSGTLSNPKTNLDSLKKKAFKASINQLLKNSKAQKDIEKQLKNILH